MKQDDKEMLITLGILGAFILAAGIGGAASLAYKTHSVGESVVGFFTESFIAFAGMYIGLSRD